MKKLIALLMIVSFITVNVGGAFADIRSDRGRVSGKVERKLPDKKPGINRPVQQNNKPAVNRPAQPKNNPFLNRPNQPKNNPFLNRPAHPNNKPVLKHQDRQINNDIFRRNRPITRHNDSFFNRTRIYNRRPFPPHSTRPYYYKPYSRSSNNSLTPLEFLGLGAAIIAIAAAVTHTCDYDY